MSKLAWLTPDDDHAGLTCFRVVLPEGFDWLAAFRGAFLLLCESHNWEASGTLTPDYVAGEFTDAFFETVENWERCVSGHFPGEIIWYAGADTPENTLSCDGAAYSPDAYPNLYAAIGYTYGTSDYPDFNVPDLRGRVPFGMSYEVQAPDWPLAQTGGENFHTLTENEMPSHSHGYRKPQNSSGSSTGLNWLTTANLTTQPNMSGSVQSAGGGAPHENRPPYLVLHPVIYYA